METRYGSLVPTLPTEKVRYFVSGQIAGLLGMTLGLVVDHPWIGGFTLPFIVGGLKELMDFLINRYGTDGCRGVEGLRCVEWWDWIATVMGGLVIVVAVLIARIL